MTEFVSEVKTIPFNEDRIFNMLSDLSNLGKVQDRIPQDKIQDFEFDKDSCSFSVAPVGKITFQIVEREPNKTIKFTTTNSPVPLFLWIQLKQVEENDTRMKITVRAELNPFIKPMVSKPLQDAIDKISTMLHPCLIKCFFDGSETLGKECSGRPGSGYLYGRQRP